MHKHPQVVALDSSLPLYFDLDTETNEVKLCCRFSNLEIGTFSTDEISIALANLGRLALRLRTLYDTNVGITGFDPTFLIYALLGTLKVTLWFQRVSYDLGYLLYFFFV